VSFGLNQLRALLAQYLNDFLLVGLGVDLNERKVDVTSNRFDVVILGKKHLDTSNLISPKYRQLIRY